MATAKKKKLTYEESVEQFFVEVEEFAGRKAAELELEEPVILVTSQGVGGLPLDMTISLDDDEDCCEVE